MANRRHTEVEKYDMEQFKQRIKKYSTKALDTLEDIMENSESEANRLKASQYILEKALGRNFKAYENEQILHLDDNVNIQLISVGEVKDLTEEELKEIEEVQNELCNLN